MSIFEIFPAVLILSLLQFTYAVDILGQLKPRKQEPLVINGKDAPVIPYQAALFVERNGMWRFYCGGSLISKNYVLTAAHCLANQTVMMVKLGITNLDDPAAVSIKSSQLIIHENYKDLQYDIGLIKLSVTVETNERIQPVALPRFRDARKTYRWTDAIVSGWGLTQNGATNVPNKLQWAEVTTTSNKYCNLYYFGAITKRQICTNLFEFQNTCNGDSGGPLCLKKGGAQIGIVSFRHGIGCTPIIPVGYTRITSFLSWIQSKSDVKINL